MALSKDFLELNIEMFVYFLDLIYFEQSLFEVEIDGIKATLFWEELLLAKKRFPDLYKQMVYPYENKCYIVNQIWKAILWQIEHDMPGSSLPGWVKFLMEKEISSHIFNPVCQEKFEILLRCQRAIYLRKPEYITASFFNFA